MKDLNILKQTDRFPKKALIGLFSAFFLITAASLIWASGNQEKEDVLSEENVLPGAFVRVEKIGEADSQRAELSKTAFFSSKNSSAEVLSQYSGRIEKVFFQTGDFVKEGDIIACFDQSFLENSPRASLESAQRSFEIAGENLKQTEKLTEESLNLADRAVKLARIGQDEASGETARKIAEQNLKIAKDQKEQSEISARLQINSARLQLEQSSLQLKQAKIAYEKTLVRSPVSGKLVSLEIREKDFLNPGVKVASVLGEGSLEATVYLAKEEISLLRKDELVRVEADGKIFEGRISGLSDFANPANSRFEVKIILSKEASSVANRSGKIYFSLNLSGGGESGGFFVPLESVNIGQSKKEVFVVSDSKAFSREVETGRIVGTKIEIVSGLSRGDVLIVENAQNIQEGQRVIIEE